MDKPRKSRADAVLKTLPPDRQSAIAEFGNSHSLDESVAWLAKDGIRIGRTAVGEFLSWYGLRQQLGRNESVVQGLLEDLKREQPGLADQALELAGQRFFSALAIEQQDALSWKRAQDVGFKREAMRLMERRIAVLEQQSQQAKGVAADGSLSDEEKVGRMKQIFGI